MFFDMERAQINCLEKYKINYFNYMFFAYSTTCLSHSLEKNQQNLGDPDKDRCFLLCFVKDTGINLYSAFKYKFDTISIIDIEEDYDPTLHDYHHFTKIDHII